RLRDNTAPLSAIVQSRKVRRLIDRIDPDLVHAMRVPFEGILAGEALKYSTRPLLVSIWGTDFTLQASSSPLVRAMTVRAMRRADAVHPDCRRDLRLAIEHRFCSSNPSIVLPGNGGVRTHLFKPGPRDAALAAKWNIPDGSPVIINPRGLKPYIRFDTFFQSIPLVLAKRPNAVFLGAQMQEIAVAKNWISKLSIASSVRCLPFVSHDVMASFFRLADVTVSPSDHDGSPNTLLESMACGSFPVAGNIESVREWIDDGVNGLLCDQSNPESLAAATLKALEDAPLRKAACELNIKIIEERAQQSAVMARADAFYSEVVAFKGLRQPSPAA
ncbi:MAG TPA: glycosyltransferase family 4 protein, partial [Chthonomonadales bacterium]|nr:glycosyltransferase family 4 protein [Chthonomonadales bacterium]